MSSVIDFNKSKVMSNLKQRRSRVMILASSLDCTIGKDNTIPWSCKTDMQFFKRATTGNVIIMGRKTYESLGNRPLPNRVNIVISKTIGQESVPEEVIVVTNLMDALVTARNVDLNTFNRNTLDEHVFIIGGVQLYNDSINNVDEVLWSTIDVKCGEHGYGSDFIVNKLLPKFEFNPEYISKLIYLNDDAIPDNGQDNLRQIIHFHKNNTINILIFKETK